MGRLHRSERHVPRVGLLWGMQEEPRVYARQLQESLQGV